jgi:hypothetical protein
MPSRQSLEALRLPLAVLLLVGVAALYWSGSRPSEAAAPAVAAGPVEGEVLGGAADSTPTALPTIAATPSPPPTPVATPVPTPPPGPFDAQVAVCLRIDGAECQDEVRRVLPRGADAVVALVHFENAWPGDVIEAVLHGPDGPVAGGPFALDGGGTGYYYATFSVADLPGGRYEVVATRNADEVASAAFRKRGQGGG